jgi:GT2 family glycosyltransferase
LKNVTGIVVTHNTKAIFQRAYESVRKFYPDMKIIVVDGSDKGNPCREYVKSLTGNTQVILADYNIGHGKGMCLGLQSVKTPFALFFDSDIEMLKSPLQDMLSIMDKDTFGVGTICDTDFGGFGAGVREAETLKGTMTYMHPYFQLVQVANYYKYMPYIHHGAPCAQTMLNIHRLGLSSKVLKVFDVPQYVKHDFYGTRAARSSKGLSEIEGQWDDVKEKTKSITCITCTGDREETFALSQRWMADQTVRPDQWLVVDDGKIPTKIDLPYCKYVRRATQKNDPRHTMILNLKTALPLITGEIVLFWEDDEYYAPTYIEEMVKKLEKYEAAGIVKSRYYHLFTGRYTRHDNKDHASLAQVGFKKSFIKELETVLQGDQFLDIRIWEKLWNRAVGWEPGKFDKQVVVNDRAILFDDGDDHLYVGMKGMPGRLGIGSCHTNVAGLQLDTKDRKVLRSWVKDSGHFNLYAKILNIGSKEKEVFMGKYRATKRGYIKGIGIIEAGQVFPHDGAPGSWMQPVAETLPAIEPKPEADIYEAAKKVTAEKGSPAADAKASEAAKVAKPRGRAKKG